MIRAWGSDVPGIVEVFHAHFTDHAYPSHTHDAWTLLIIDDGAVRYDLDRHEHGALRASVTLLPPHVPHDGRAATPQGFRKRVLYLDNVVLGPDLIGRAVDRPAVVDAGLRRGIAHLHDTLVEPGEDLGVAERLALIGERLRGHLTGTGPPHTPPPAPPPGLARQLRELLDSRVVAGVRLEDAAAELAAHPTHLVRAFTRAYGLPPHRYLTGRRVDLARRLVVAGIPLADVATESGFHDQAHLTRHFRRLLGTSPGRFGGRR